MKHRTSFAVKRALAAVAIAAAVLPAASATAADLPAGSTSILSGTPSLRDPLPAPAGTTGAQRSSVSQDGRFIAFDATSDGLTAIDDDLVRNVYVKDRLSGSVTLASRANGLDGAPSHSNCFDGAISDNGQRVAFVCEGPLDPEADRNSANDIYVRDLTTGMTELVSRATLRGTVGNHTSAQPDISGSGEYVAFTSGATNLDPDTSGMPHGTRVYLRRIGSGDQTQLVGRRSSAAGNAPVDGTAPSVSDDGNRIAFVSLTQIDNADGNGHTDVYVRDVAERSTILVSRANGPTGATGNRESDHPSISGTGYFVAFQTRAENLVDPSPDSDGEFDVYWRSLITGAVRLVSQTAGVKGKYSDRPSIDDSGNYVSFVSASTNLDPADTKPNRDVYLRRVSNGVIELVSRADGDDGAALNLDAMTAGLSGNGKTIAMHLAGGATPDVDRTTQSVAVRDLTVSPKRTTTVSRPAGDAPFVNQGGRAVRPRVSTDGRYVAFAAAAPGLGLPPGVPRGVFVRDRVTGDVTLASRENGLGGAAMTGSFGQVDISADGRRVAFVRVGTEQGMYVRDLPTGRTMLAGAADGEAGAPANASIDELALDGDGSRVAFSTTASNLGDGDTDQEVDVHVRDVDAGRTFLVSRADGAAVAKANGASLRPAISADGTRVAFESTATNLGDGDIDVVPDIHLRDLSADRTVLVSNRPDGVKGNKRSGRASIDASGSRIAFESVAENFPGARQGTTEVYVRDLAAGSLVLASRADGPGGAAALSNVHGPVISNDGTHVAFTTNASGLVPGRLPAVEQGYRRDLAAGRTELVTRANGPDGAPSERDSFVTDISAGGGCVAFESDSLIGPPSDFAQVYLRAFRADCAAADPVVDEPTEPGTGDQDGGGGGPRGAGPDTVAPALSAVRLSRKRFRVGPKPTAVAAAQRVLRGTVLRFRSSEPATLTITLDRVRKAKRRISWKRSGRLRRRIAAGPSRVAFTGRVGRKRLKPGRYRVRLVARDAAGNASKRVELRFTVVRG